MRKAIVKCGGMREMPEPNEMTDDELIHAVCKLPDPERLLRHPLGETENAIYRKDKWETDVLNELKGRMRGKLRFNIRYYKGDRENLPSYGAYPIYPNGDYAPMPDFFHTVHGLQTKEEGLQELKDNIANYFDAQNISVEFLEENNNLYNTEAKS